MLERKFKNCIISSDSQSGACHFDCIKKDIQCNCNVHGNTYNSVPFDLLGLQYLNKTPEKNAMDNAIIDCASYKTHLDQISAITCTSIKQGDKITDNCQVRFHDGTVQEHQPKKFMALLFQPFGERNYVEPVVHPPTTGPSEIPGEKVVSQNKSEFDACRKSEHFHSADCEFYCKNWNERTKCSCYEYYEKTRTEKHTTASAQEIADMLDFTNNKHLEQSVDGYLVRCALSDNVVLNAIECKVSIQKGSQSDEYIKYNKCSVHYTLSDGSDRTYESNSDHPCQIISEERKQMIF